MRAQDLGGLFDALDVNGDGSLSAGELALYIEGAKLDREARRRQIGDDLKDELGQEIERLFREFDENNDGEVSAEEIKRALQACRMDKSLKECQRMIDQANEEAGKRGPNLGEAAFAKLMMPFMLDELCGQEENTEEIRDLFRRADVDGSGYLTLDELAGALKAKQIDVDPEDLVQLMAELDVDRDGKLEIDELAALLSCGDHVTFRNAASRGAFLQIRRARRLGAADFLKSFKHMPAAFGPSFIGERWRARDLLPASVFKPQIDLHTMLWKDILPVKSEELPEDQRKPGRAPHLRSTTTSLGASIQLVQAQGVPLPQAGKDKAYSDEHVLKRVIRVAIQTSGDRHGHAAKSGGDRDQRKRQPVLVHNTLQIPARWQKGAEDVWEFDGDSAQR